jgi:hypothetical protein
MNSELNNDIINQDYTIEPIANGFQLITKVNYDKREVWAFMNWADLVKHLEDNPPKFFERVPSGTLIELEYDPETFVVDQKGTA